MLKYKLWLQKLGYCQNVVTICYLCNNASTCKCFLSYLTFRYIIKRHNSLGGIGIGMHQMELELLLPLFLTAELELELQIFLKVGLELKLKLTKWN